MATLRPATDALMLSLVDAAYELVERVTQETGPTYEIGKTLTLLQAPNRWSEDFDVYSGVCRCTMFILGTGETAHALHDSAYDFPDALIEHGIEMFWTLLHKQLLFDD
ncbi:unnamed protein product [Rotaria sp. Silwood1]|nr:unnamed protein product [Rotaria sp. Silwood1]CAF1669526.1 unnamed protein product [Rotaria sp. Silwood1]